MRREYLGILWFGLEPATETKHLSSDAMSVDSALVEHRDYLRRLRAVLGLTVRAGAGASRPMPAPMSCEVGPLECRFRDVESTVRPAISTCVATSPSRCMSRRTILFGRRPDVRGPARLATHYGRRSRNDAPAVAFVSGVSGLRGVRHRLVTPRCTIGSLSSSPR